MKCRYTRYLTGCALGLLLVSAGAAAQSTRADPLGEISTTLDNQILLELRPGDTADPNPVDLEGRTLVFAPDGHGGYSRSVLPLAWEDHLAKPLPTKPWSTSRASCWTSPVNDGVPSTSAGMAC